MKAGDVDAEFIPPGIRKDATQQQWAGRSAEAHA